MRAPLPAAAERLGWLLGHLWHAADGDRRRRLRALVAAEGSDARAVRRRLRAAFVARARGACLERLLLRLDPVSLCRRLRWSGYQQVHHAGGRGMLFLAPPIGSPRLALRALAIARPGLCGVDRLGRPSGTERAELLAAVRGGRSAAALPAPGASLAGVATRLVVALPSAAAIELRFLPAGDPAPSDDDAALAQLLAILEADDRLRPWWPWLAERCRRARG